MKTQDAGDEGHPGRGIMKNGSKRLYLCAPWKWPLAFLGSVIGADHGQ